MSSRTCRSQIFRGKSVLRSSSVSGGSKLYERSRYSEVSELSSRRSGNQLSARRTTLWSPTMGPASKSMGMERVEPRGASAESLTAASPSSEPAGNCSMSRVEGTRNGIHEQEGNAKAEKVAALDPSPVPRPVLVTLQLDEGVERLSETTWMSRRETERIAAVHEDACLSPHEIGSWWVSPNEIVVEGDAEGVETLLTCSDSAYPSP